MSAVAIIPARGGSQRVPKKNIRPFFGKPVIAYPIIEAAKSGLFDAIYVSTDDLMIADVARQFGAMTLGRSAKMALDEVGTQEVTRDAIQQLYPFPDRNLALPDYTYCIYPCSPLLYAADLQIADYKLLTAPCTYVMVTGLFYGGSTRAFLDRVPLEGNSIELPWKERYIDINEVEDFDKAAQVYLKLLVKGEV